MRGWVKARVRNGNPSFLRLITPNVQPFPLPDLSTREGQEAFALLLGDAELIDIDNLSTLMRTGPMNEGERWPPVAA